MKKLCLLLITLPLFCLLVGYSSKVLAEKTDSLFQNAHKLYVKGQYPEAIKFYQQLLKKNKLDLASRYELARSYLAIGHYEQVENTLEFLTTLTQNDFAAFKAGQLLDIARGLWLYATRTGEKKLFHAVNGTILPRAEQLAKTPELYIFWGN
ncbi:MAG: tetratricopeptide repeat protein, partial [Planctomycetes bacterium]|nr:tetratricopeptide repeat protein [Planctomycetota bacterium]